MKFQIKITEKDYICFNKIHFKNSKNYKATNKAVALITFAILACNVFTNFYFNDTDSIIDPVIKSLLLIFLYWLFIIFLFPRFSIKIAERSVKSMKKDGKLPFDEDSEIEFFDDMFTDKSAHNETRLKYSEVEKLIITDDYMFIYLDSSRATIVPLEQLNNDKENVIELLKAKVSNEKIINQTKLS